MNLTRLRSRKYLAMKSFKTLEVPFYHIPVGKVRSKTNFPLLLEYARKWVLPLGTDDATEALKCKQVSHIKHSIYYVLLLSFRFSMSHLLLQCVLLSIKGLLSRLIDTATLCFGLSSLLQGIVCSLIHYLRYWKERDP